MCCVWRHHIHILGAKWEFSVTTILHSKSDWTLADRLSECRPIVKSSFMCLSYKYYMCHKSVLVHTYGRSRRSSYWSNTAVKCHLQCLYYLSPTFSNKNVVSFPKWQRMYLTTVWNDPQRLWWPHLIDAPFEYQHVHMWDGARDGTEHLC